LRSFVANFSQAFMRPILRRYGLFKYLALSKKMNWKLRKIVNGHPRLVRQMFILKRVLFWWSKRAIERPG